MIAHKEVGLITKSLCLGPDEKCEALGCYFRCPVESRDNKDIWYGAPQSAVLVYIYWSNRR